MYIKILTPTEIFANEKVKKINAEDKGGYFTLLPKHADVVSSLSPSILSYHLLDDDKRKDKEVFVAIDGGVLVKCGDKVEVSTRRAIFGANLKELHTALEKEFKNIDDNEKKARTALAMLEGNMAKLFIDLNE